MTLSLFDVLDPKPAALPPPPQPLPIREGALPSPPAAPTIGALQLRPYQRECVNSVLSEFRRGVKKTLCVLATGAGKGTLGVELVRQAEMRGHGVLWLAHREELLLDIKGRMSRVGIHGLLEKAGERAIGNYGIESKVVVGSVQTMQGKRLEQWPADAFQLIVADEAHHVISRQHRQVLARFPKARVVGLTATPDRLDRKNIGRIFESLAYEFNLKQCIEGGYLVPLVAERLALDPPLDLRNLRTTAGDFNTGDLEAEVQANIGRLANALADTQILGNRKTIAFTPDIESAMSLAEAANDVGIPAEAISYKTKNRAQAFERFRNGRVQLLVNSMICTEGVDLPFVSAVLLARPSKSRALVSQMIGRGTRLDPNNPGKTDCLIIDLPALLGEHKLITPVELFNDGKIQDDVLEEAQQMAEEAAEKGEQLDLKDALEEAEARVEERKRVIVRRQASGVRRQMRFDPLATMEAVGLRPNRHEQSSTNFNPPSERMIGFLNKMKVPNPEQMSHAQAGQLIGKLKERMDAGKASHGQVNYLISLGVEPKAARNMSFEEAGAEISRRKAALGR